MAFWAQNARPQKLRPTPIGARIHAESGQGSDVAESICLVTVTCDGNGAAAAARPAMIPHRRLRWQQRPRPPREPRQARGTGGRRHTR